MELRNKIIMLGGWISILFSLPILLLSIYFYINNIIIIIFIILSILLFIYGLFVILANVHLTKIENNNIILKRRIILNLNSIVTVSKYHIYKILYIEKNVIKLINEYDNKTIMQKLSPISKNILITLISEQYLKFGILYYKNDISNDINFSFPDSYYIDYK